MPQVKSRNVPVNVPGEVYEKVAEYSKLTGVPVTKVTVEALSDWLDTVGAARMEAIAETKKGTLLIITGRETLKTRRDAIQGQDTFHEQGQDTVSSVCP